MVAFAKTNSVANFTEMLQRVALHEALLEKFAIDGEKLESDTFTFTFIRHPFHRIVSTVNFRFKHVRFKEVFRFKEEFHCSQNFST